MTIYTKLFTPSGDSASECNSPGLLDQQLRSSCYSLSDDGAGLSCSEFTDDDDFATDVQVGAIE